MVDCGIFYFELSLHSSFGYCSNGTSVSVISKSLGEICVITYLCDVDKNLRGSLTLQCASTSLIFFMGCNAVFFEQNRFDHSCLGQVLPYAGAMGVSLCLRMHDCHVYGGMGYGALKSQEVIALQPKHLA